MRLIPTIPPPRGDHFSAADCLGICSSAAGGGGDVLPFKATETTLANGLKVIVVPTGFPNLVSIQIPVQTGSRNEVEPGKSGFAHFFEHLMFRGTPNTPPREVPRDHDARPARATTRAPATTRTHYYATFAKEDLETILGLYADIFQHLAYSEADFKTEARAVLGEYNKNSADPFEKLFEVQRDRFYQAHTYKHTTMGFIARHREHAERVRVLEGVLRALVPPAVHDRHRRRRRDAGAGAAAGREVLGRLEGAARRRRRRSRRSRRRRGRCTSTCRGRATRCPGSRSRFPARRSTRRARTRRRCDILAALYFGPTSELYKKLVVAEQKVDSTRRRRAGQRRPVALHRLRAREEAGRRRLRARPDPRDRCGGARRAGAGAAARRGEVVRPLRVRPDARQHRADRAR